MEEKEIITKEEIAAEEAPVEVASISLYEMNKQIMKQVPVATDEEIDALIEKLHPFMKSNHSKYWMMLCAERRDYTLFNLDKTGSYHVIPTENFVEAAKDVIDCLKNRGEIIGAYQEKDKTAWELWIKINDEAFAYYLFSYDTAVLEY